MRHSPYHGTTLTPPKQTISDLKVAGRVVESRELTGDPNERCPGWRVLHAPTDGGGGMSSTCLCSARGERRAEGRCLEDAEML